MGKNFYLKLAANNIKRNQKKYTPYFIAASIMVCVYFMVVLILYTPGLANVPENTYLKQLFGIGLYTLTIFISVFMLYINNFLIKQRKKELGLYGILGLEKRHVGYVILWENLCINGAAMLLGVLTGCVFGWLIFMLLIECIKVTADTYFTIPIEAFTKTGLYFTILFVAVSVLNILQVRMANPIDLLKSDHAGEKKTRFVIPITLLGIIMLGYAYYIAWTVTNPLQAILRFFIAVILVIFATYALFITGSIAMLKFLKKRKKYYYKPDNFVSVAGMIHRMKQNASGLASICILSTMVLVTVSTCFALFFGQEDTLSSMNKDDMKIEISGEATEEQYKQMTSIVDQAASDNSVKIEEMYQYFSYDGMVIYEDNQFIFPETKIDIFAENLPNYRMISFLTLADFNRVCKLQETLGENQLILLSNEGEYENITEIKLGDAKDEKSYEVVSRKADTIFTNGKNRKANEEVYIVIKDLDKVRNLVEIGNPYLMSPCSSKTIVNIKGSQEECYKLSYQVKNEARKMKNFLQVDSIYTNRSDAYSMYGGLLFMGAFFTVIFLCATVLIIYFKQISEGYEDKDRFEMLQKVGMDDREVKKTINKQILIVFFLPLLGALLHLAMASHMIIKLLEVFEMNNVKLTTLCMMCASTVFALVYVFVYRLTAKTYVKIVQW